ncbi:unnamed protein product [Rotaria sordida]|uniref:Uncharacterized protein n=1 Tax=Rotaria sordida TaxID=392033 RepID=A0A813Y2S9_9BILA|nr:unnamed protein product [Rotaria sordida]CAF1498309.1 unnamed protein product [Rotaria sordida]
MTKSCCKCDKSSQTFTCNGCNQTFCNHHTDEHREELTQQMKNIEQEHNVLKQRLSQQTISKTLLAQIDQWKKKSIEKIQWAAQIVRTNLQQFTEELNNHMSDLINKLSNELRLSREKSEYSEDDLHRWMKHLEELQIDLEKLSKIELSHDNFSSDHLIKIKTADERENNKADPKFSNIDRSDGKPTEVIMSSNLSTDGQLAITSSRLHKQQKAYPSSIFGLNQYTDKKKGSLLEDLMNLAPIEKNGPMSGQCDPQTHQMERFLSDVFGFKNIPGKYIVHDVKSFQLDKPLHSLNPNTQIHFPKNIANSFTIIVQEIIDWQCSYKVYADKNIKGTNKEFLKRALQGQSQDGEEAFRMKFVPDRIKLVSATGIDFAGRKHDVDDILYYISNWEEVFHIGQRSNLPVLYNGRDFYQKANGPRGKLHEEHIRKSLMRMARLRLRACDEEVVQIVVETGIGLGVFSGSHIGINAKNIRAIVFALPIFNKNKSNDRHLDAFDDFVNEFHKTEYNGPIPVLIADQDMYRVTVAIARRGFTVSERNPADSHGVFGEYWENRGPSVEEKLALTTVGLLVQHHLINPCVLDVDHQD